MSLLIQKCANELADKIVGLARIEGKIRREKVTQEIKCVANEVVS